MNYTIDEICVWAKRYKNAKRGYLLVNPLQAKHIPAKPKKTYALFTALGDYLKQRYRCSLVIGFAETATALGAYVARAFGEDTFYLCTTREEDTQGKWISFLEEHSHAVDQRLRVDVLKKPLEEAMAYNEDIILIDDEISTGKTLMNIVSVLRETFPELSGRRIILASLINRASEENIQRLREQNIVAEALFFMPNTDGEQMVSDYIVHAPSEEFYGMQTESRDLLSGGIIPKEEEIFLEKELFLEKAPDPFRSGVRIGQYFQALAKIEERLKQMFKKPEKILLLGTEECMAAAISTGLFLSEAGHDVYVHATTRSPIGISEQKDYPIRLGYKIHSLYDEKRTTYIYCMENYDRAFILSDADRNAKGKADLEAVLLAHGVRKIHWIMLI